MMKLSGVYFHGNKASDYAIENGYLDYETLAKAFDAVMNNDIIQKTNAAGLGYWEPYSGSEFYYELDGERYTPEEKEEKTEELESHLDEVKAEIDELYEIDTEDEQQADEITSRIEDLEEEAESIQADIDELEDEHCEEIFQWFIVDSRGADILEEAGEIVYYNSELDMYIWGVTHWGTSWDYVLTNIKLNQN